MENVLLFSISTIPDIVNTDIDGGLRKNRRFFRRFITINISDSVEHITGSARYSAPGMDIISVRSEDLLEDLELEVMANLEQFGFSNYQLW